VPTVNKNKCYNIIENYLISRLTTWKIDPNDIVNAKLSGTPNEKRTICFELVRQISDCKTTEKWAKLCYLLTDLTAQQKQYERGLQGFFSNKQAIVPMLEKIKFVILNSLQNDSSFSSLLSKIKQKILHKKSSINGSRATEKFNGSIVNSLLEEDKQSLGSLERKLIALDTKQISPENKVIILENESNTMVNKILEMHSTEKLASVTNELKEVSLKM